MWQDLRTTTRLHFRIIRHIQTDTVYPSRFWLKKERSTGNPFKKAAKCSTASCAALS